MTHPTLSQQLAGNDIVVAPGVYDAFSAASAERAGFQSAYLSGASIAYSRFGRPDIGLVSMNEVAETVSTIRERLDLPLIVDADTGFGNALNVQRTVRLFERCGASALQIEDQSMPKRCGHLKGKSLVSPAEVVGKIKAATDARASDETLIIARTDAIAVEGFSAAMDRAEQFVEAGADILFIEAPQDVDQMKILTKHFQGRVPLLANMVEGGLTPMHDAASLQAMGYKLVIFPGGLVRARARMEQDYFASLKATGWNDPFRDRMLDVTQLNELLGTDQILEDGARYDAVNFEAKK
jgi:2-methylisocitrate lyase-like PEP mutase family enzyme